MKKTTDSTHRRTSSSSLFSFFSPSSSCVACYCYSRSLLLTSHFPCVLARLWPYFAGTIITLAPTWLPSSTLESMANNLTSVLLCSSRRPVVVVASSIRPIFPFFFFRPFSSSWWFFFAFVIYGWPPWCWTVSPAKRALSGLDWIRLSSLSIRDVQRTKGGHAIMSRDTPDSQ